MSIKKNETQRHLNNLYRGEQLLVNLLANAQPFCRHDLICRYEIKQSLGFEILDHAKRVEESIDSLGNKSNYEDIALISQKLAKASLSLVQKQGGGYTLILELSLVRELHELLNREYQSVRPRLPG